MKIVHIGRSSSNDINIDDNKVSRLHCQIIQNDDGSFVLIDVDSTNGTYVNGVKRHGEVRLKRTDIIRIGNTTLPWQSYFGVGGNTEIDARRTQIDRSGSYTPYSQSRGENVSGSSKNDININIGNDQGYRSGGGVIYDSPAPIEQPEPPRYKPDNFMVWAVLSTIFCCLPFGIVSIVQASKVNGLWYAGRYDEAEEAAASARSWFWWSFTLGLISGIISMIYYAVVIGAMM